MDPEHIRPVPARAGSDQDCRVCMRCCWHPTDPATNVLSWQFFGGKILGGFSFGFLIDIVDMRYVLMMYHQMNMSMIQNTNCSFSSEILLCSTWNVSRINIASDMIKPTPVNQSCFNRGRRAGCERQSLSLCMRMWCRFMWRIHVLACFQTATTNIWPHWWLVTFVKIMIHDYDHTVIQITRDKSWLIWLYTWGILRT